MTPMHPDDILAALAENLPYRRIARLAGCTVVQVDEIIDGKHPHRCDVRSVIAAEIGRSYDEVWGSKEERCSVIDDGEWCDVAALVAEEGAQ